MSNRLPCLNMLTDGMLTWIREKFGKVIIGGIIGLIVLIFVFSGVLSPRSTRGLHEGSVAGTVNGDSVTLSEFNRELNRRIEIFKSFGGGKITEEQLKSLKIREMVFQELVSRKLLIQEAQHQGMMAADEEVKQKIQEIPGFQKEGKFDLSTYQQVLEANRYTPGSFEKLVREDLSAQRWNSFFKDRVKVSETEVKNEWLMSMEKRKLRHVLLTPELVKKKVQVDPAEVEKFLADPAQLAMARQKFEADQKKKVISKADAGSVKKGSQFEDVQQQVVHDILAQRQVEKVQEELKKAVVNVLARLEKLNLTGSDRAINAALSSLGLKVTTTDWLTQKESMVSGFGDSKEVLRAAFGETSSIDPKKGGGPKEFQSADRFLIAWVQDTQKADLSKFESDRLGLIQKLVAKKSRNLFQSFLATITQKASIDPNPQVLQIDES